jgi:hypothetical protein
MKRKALALTLILSLFVLASAGTLLIQNGAKMFIVQGETSNSNTIVNGNPNTNVTIQSPQNRTYNANNVTLGFTIESGVPPIENFSWRIAYPFFLHGIALDYDTSNLVNLILWYNSAPIGKFPDNVSASLSSLGNNVYVGNATLTNLSQGVHNVTVWVSVYQFMLSYDVYEGAVLSTVSFSIPPQITVLSPETKAYNVSDVPLNFIVNETFSKIKYGLDGQNNVTINGNATLTGLSNGYHNVTVYATDEFGNTGVSKIIRFTVEAPEHFPTTLVIASVVTVAFVVVVLLFYFKKRKH